jgi:hypothetical protein
VLVRALAPLGMRFFREVIVSMRASSVRQSQLMERLDRLAGNSAIVDEALQNLTQKRGRDPTLRELVREVLRRRLEYERSQKPVTA